MLLDDAGTVASGDLVAAIAAGSKSAEREFVRRFAPGVRTLVRRHTRPGDPVVDDLTQDVLANVLLQLRAGGVREAAALPGYVRSAVVHATGAEYRRRRPEVAAHALDVLATEDSPPAALAAGQLRTLLHNLLGELPVPRDREVLRQFYLEELDRDTVCQRLGIEVEHFHRVVFRARERLRGLLEGAGVTENPT